MLVLVDALSRMEYTWFYLILTISISLTPSCPFFIPWTSHRDYADGDSVTVQAVKMTSNSALIAYDYYSLKFCEHPAGVQYSKENIGEMILGDRDVIIPISFAVLEDMSCRVVCKKSYSDIDTDSLISRISHEYFIQLTVDDLPVITEFIGDESVYELGYRIGFSLDDKYYINNHLDFTLKYHSASTPGEYSIVGFSVRPRSVQPSDLNGAPECAISEGHSAYELTPGQAHQILFSYSATWIASEGSWSSRWDRLLRPKHKEVHWFSIVNSLAIVLLLSGVVAAILTRVLRRDISHYNRVSDELTDSPFDESGWKLVHGDVFRPPANPSLLTALLGSGVHLFSTLLIVFLVACLGFLSPDKKGVLVTFGFVVYMLMGAVGGYVAGRFYKSMGGSNYKKTAISTAAFYPSIVFSISLILNQFLTLQHSSQVLSLRSILAIVTLWTTISLPLGFAGFYFGYSKEKHEFPVRVNLLARPISPLPWYLSLVPSALFSGMLPFGALLLEFYFVLSAIWEHHFYYLFGFLFVVFLIFTISTCQVAIINTYLLLCSEDYHWWWRSSYILSTGVTAYVFGYILLFHLTRVGSASFVSFLFYWGYSAIMLLTLWLLSGTIGLYCSYVFVRAIYSAIKVD